VDLGLRDNVAMVAGASRGLGFAIAQALAAEGVRVSVSSRNESAITQAALGIGRATGAEVLATVADVSSAADIERWRLATVERWGGVDLLVTNSGGPPPGGFASLSDEAWQSGFELLVLSTIRMVRTVLPSMRGRANPSILMLTSSSVKEPIVNLTLSNVLRASIAALAKTLSIELAGEGIRVNHLIPGRIATDRLKELDAINSRRAGISLEEHQKRSVAAIPLGRYGAPDEFARAAVFLLSGAAGYITGAALQVDGGLIRTVM
jgi:3-oxoacyl-[acyl-carrier protein] reductase